MRTPKIKIRGWRGVSHSYAMVNQFQLLAMHQIAPDLICHEDVPYLVASWNAQNNSAGLNAKDSTILGLIEDSNHFEAIYNIFAPGRLHTEKNKKCMTFMVTETGYSLNHFPMQEIHDYQMDGGLIHTPSHWSRDRLLDAGIPFEMMHVIPHAAENRYFYRYTENKISGLRASLNYEEDEIILLNVGSFFWNKGLDILVKSYTLARRKNKKLRLILKDQLATYGTSSREHIGKYLAELGEIDEDLLNSIQIVDSNVTLPQLNDLYNIADAYVTPYRAEGFNLPACEAQQCMTPVVATRGGATDDFLDEDINHFIDGTRFNNQKISPEHDNVTYIEPSQESLVSILESISRKTNSTESIIESHGWRNVALKIMGILI